MSEIKHLLVLALTDQLTTYMKSNVPTSNPTRATIVQAYRFQDDPLDAGVYIWVSDGDSNDVFQRDARINTKDMENIGLKNIPSGEVGGGHLWWRRGKIVIGCFYVNNKFTQEVAGDHAHTVLGRASYWTERTAVAGITDEWGEKALDIAVVGTSFFGSGGPPDQYIWRGDVTWQVLTSRPR